MLKREKSIARKLNKWLRANVANTAKRFTTKGWWAWAYARGVVRIDCSGTEEIVKFRKTRKAILSGLKKEGYMVKIVLDAIEVSTGE